MKALVTPEDSLPSSVRFSLIELPDPTPPEGHDLLVRVEAVSINPVDAKLRRTGTTHPRILGFDAAGTVEQAGPLSGFQAGDTVYYAGEVQRPGSNATRQLVDGRLVALRPGTLDQAHAAALPLVSLTAWELLFVRMPFQPDGQSGAGQSLLVIGAAGGVGSLAMQLGRLAGFHVIATASRPASIDWCRSMGAAAVINHHEPLAPQLAALGHAQVDVILNLADTDAYWDQIGELIAPRGHVGLIVEPVGALRIGDPYKAKSVSLHWEFMFTRSRYRTKDMEEQQRILERVALLVDSGDIKPPLTSAAGRITAANLEAAHRQIETGGTIGKLVLSGWE